MTCLCIRELDVLINEKKSVFVYERCICIAAGVLNRTLLPGYHLARSHTTRRHSDAFIVATPL